MKVDKGESVSQRLNLPPIIMKISEAINELSFFLFITAKVFV